MTGTELYDYGRNAAPARACIPRELVQSLPRLERINGRIVVQFWYYYQNVMYPFSWDMPMYYAAFDPEEDQLVEMQALTGKNSFFDSWLDLVSVYSQMRELRYLEHCAALLERGNITEAEIIYTQALWLDAQAKDIFPWLYGNSNIRPEAVELLLSPEMAKESRYLLMIWEMECMKYRVRRAEGWEKLEERWFDETFVSQRDIFWELRSWGPLKGLRTLKDG